MTILTHLITYSLGFLSCFLFFLYIGTQEKAKQEKEEAKAETLLPHPDYFYIHAEPGDWIH